MLLPSILIGLWCGNETHTAKFSSYHKLRPNHALQIHSLWMHSSGKFQADLCLILKFRVSSSRGQGEAFPTNPLAPPPTPHKTLTSINFLQTWKPLKQSRGIKLQKFVPRSLAYFKRPLIYHTSTPYFCRKMKPCKSSKKRRCKKTYQLSRYKKIAYFESEGGTMFQFRVRKTHHLLLNPLPRDTSVAPIIVSNGQK